MNLRSLITILATVLRGFKTLILLGEFLPCGASGLFSNSNRPFSSSTKEPGSNDILMQFYTRGSI